MVKYYTNSSMSSAEKKKKVGRLTGGSEHEREALQLRTYNVTLVPQGKTEDTTTVEQRSVIIRGLAASAVPPDTDTARVAYFQIRGRCVGVQSGSSSSSTTPTTIATGPVPLLIYKHRTTRNSPQ